MKILVTGGAGFVGSALVRYLIRETDSYVVNVDSLTYAANLAALEGTDDNPRYAFEHHDITSGPHLADIFLRHRPDAVIHLAAESHVDRSIDGPRPFIDTNIVGTYMLLETSYRYYAELDCKIKKNFRFLHVSTDEVYGSLGKTGTFGEESPYKPSSPYAASKASADHLVSAWNKTYGLPTVISTSTNNYGPWQFPEKLIPTVIVKALDGLPVPLYGDGRNIRDWIYVEDHASALWRILNVGNIGERYNIGSRTELSNLDISKTICAHLDKLSPRSDGLPHEQNIVFVSDRPGHDFRYALKTDKLASELDWMPLCDLDSGIARTVSWYIDKEDWWRSVLNGSYDGRRQGLDR
ncbi:MAG: dTDP-glucose 4,6-dehydratase [Magnetovibrio sp.]|nr:dTDP-glucose 4,6-dehydratase [Magnetovibrio sp.]